HGLWLAIGRCCTCLAGWLEEQPFLLPPARLSACKLLLDGGLELQQALAADAFDFDRHRDLVLARDGLNDHAFRVQREGRRIFKELRYFFAWDHRYFLVP